MGRRIRHRAQQRLLALQLGPTGLAKLLGCSRQVACGWLQGKRPRPEHRDMLRTRLGIELDDWFRAPDPEAEPITEATAPDRSDAPLASAGPDATAEDEPPPDAPAEVVAEYASRSAERASTLEAADRLIRFVDGRLRTAAATRDFSVLAGVAARLLALREKLIDGIAGDSEGLLRTPQWAQFSARLLDALKPYPDALKAVVETFERLEGENRSS